MMDAGRIKLDIDAAERRAMTVADLVQRFGGEADHLVLQAQ
jgi:hypothetical protein